MRLGSSNISAKPLYISERYNVTCSLLEENQNIQAVSTFLSDSPEYYKDASSLLLSKREDFRDIPYLIEGGVTQHSDYIHFNFHSAIQSLIQGLFAKELIDLHPLSEYKLSQMPSILSLNDMRLEMMTKNFQPHLIVVYPIIEKHCENVFEFGHQSSYWLFDPLIDALSYRRSNQKSTLIFLILRSDVERISILEKAAGDTIKLLKESIRSGMDVLTPKILFNETGQIEYTFSDRLDSFL